jgi:hypothetical protein
MRSVALATTFLTPMVAHRDMCGLFFNSEDFYCNTRGICQGVITSTSVSCEEAVSSLSIRWGARPLPSIGNGMIYQPEIVETNSWPPTLPALNGYMPPEKVLVIIEGFFKNIESINDELATWTPRVLYVPERIQSTLKDAYDGVQVLLLMVAAGVTHHGYISRVLDEQMGIREFMLTMADLVEVVLRMPNIRRDGYLNSLIPFYHLFSEVFFAFTFVQSAPPPGFLVHEPSFLQTVTQYNPMYLGRDSPVIWRIRLVNIDHIKWRSYIHERYLLEVPQSLEARTVLGDVCGRSPAATDECLAGVRSLLARLGARVAIFTGEVREMKFISDTLVDILHVYDRMVYNDSAEVPVDTIRTSIESLCQMHPNVMENIRFSRYAYTRASVLYMHHFSTCWQSVDVLGYILTPTSTRVLLSSERFREDISSDVDLLNEVDGRIRFLTSQRTYEMVPGFRVCLKREWITSFVREISAIGNVSEDGQRAFGRVIGYGLMMGGRDIFRAVIDQHRSPGWLGEIFFKSEQVRLGVYEWIPLNSFEDLLLSEGNARLGFESLWALLGTGYTHLRNS